jgi:transposase
MKYEEFLSIYHTGPEAVFEMLESMSKTIALLEQQVSELPDLRKQVAELEARLNMNSRNSSKPPSSDEFSKPKSRRKKSGRPSGGQKGHPGNTLRMVDAPDHIVVHRVDSCSSCGGPLERIETEDYEKRQVFDLPPLKLETTEHRAERVKCPHCGCISKAAFPEAVTQPVQYGNNLKSLCVYLKDYQLLPWARLTEFVKDVFHHPISEGTLFNITHAAHTALEAVTQEIKGQIVDSDVANVDETGMRVLGKRQWLHVASTNNLTHYAYHAKRGKQATDDIDILPNFNGTAVHDFWKPYFIYKCYHALCNAHHIRELIAILEITGQQWPQQMIDLLLEIKAAVEERKGIANAFEPDTIIDFEYRYGCIIKNGYTENPLPDEIPKKKRGRAKQSKARNMLDRLSNFQSETLAFMYNFNVPFENNQAERDLRMMKVKQKISGTFRSELGAEMFCRTRGYISTARKNSIALLAAINSALAGNPYLPDSGFS